MQTVFSLLTLVLVLAIPLELVLYFAAPHLLAPVAWRALGERRVHQLGRGALDALAAADAPAAVGTYRQPGGRAPELRRLSVPERWHGDGYAARAVLERGFVVVRAHSVMFGWNRSLGLARVDLSLEGDRLAASARYTPTPLSVFVICFFMSVVSFVSAAVKAPPAGSSPSQFWLRVALVGAVGLFFGAIILGTVTLFARSRLEPYVDAAVDEIFAAVDRAQGAAPRPA